METLEKVQYFLVDESILSKAMSHIIISSVYAGEMVLPDWGTTGQASSNTANTSMDVAPTNQVLLCDRIQYLPLFR